MTYQYAFVGLRRRRLAPRRRLLLLRAGVRGGAACSSASTERLRPLRRTGHIAMLTGRRRVWPGSARCRPPGRSCLLARRHACCRCCWRSVAAFKPAAEIYSTSRPWPVAADAGQLRAPVRRGLVRDLRSGTRFGTTALRVAGQVILAVLAAYAFARWEFRGRDALFAAACSARMTGAARADHDPDLPDDRGARLVRHLGGADRARTWRFPFGVFLLRQHILSFPQRAAATAAAVDGCRAAASALWRIVIPPNLGPALAGLAIVAAIETLERVSLAAAGDRQRAARGPSRWCMRRFLDARGRRRRTAR